MMQVVGVSGATFILHDDLTEDCYWTCSACGAQTHLISGYRDKGDWLYCPQCGAKIVWWEDPMREAGKVALDGWGLWRRRSE